MTDRELLEAAAKAAGLSVRDQSTSVITSFYGSWGGAWNPLTDDGDALRLAVVLGLAPSVFVANAASNGCTLVSATLLPHNELFIEEMHEADPYAATRRAIVRAAAAIGAQS